MPIVATTHGGPVDIIGTLHNGILVEPTDVVQVQGALLKMLTNAQLWDSYSCNGCTNIGAYSWPSHCSRWGACRQQPWLSVACSWHLQGATCRWGAACRVPARLCGSAAADRMPAGFLLRCLAACTLTSTCRQHAALRSKRAPQTLTPLLRPCLHQVPGGHRGLQAGPRAGQPVAGQGHHRRHDDGRHAGVCVGGGLLVRGMRLRTACCA